MTELHDENESGVVYRSVPCEQSDCFTPTNTELRRIAAAHGPPQSYFDQEPEEKPW